MFVDLIYCFAFVGGFCLILSGGYMLFVIVLFVVYKLDGGKMGIIEYFKRMI